MREISSKKSCETDQFLLCTEIEQLNTYAEFAKVSEGLMIPDRRRLCRFNFRQKFLKDLIKI